MLNTRSLKKHAVDIAKESHLMQSDIICLTETQICIYDDVSEIEQTLSDFNIHFNTSEQKFCNLAICLCNDINVVAHKRFPGLSMIDVLKPSFSKQMLRLILLYRSPNSSITLFYARLREIGRPELHVEIILGDFNIDIFNEPSNTLNILSDYELLVKEATHISGFLIDHVYLSKSLLLQMSVENVIVSNVCFSDPDVQDSSR